MLKFKYEDRGEKVVKKKNPKGTNVRKYVNFCLLMVAIVLVVFIAAKIYNKYQENKLGSSVFSGIVGNIQYNDVENVTEEMPSNAFILISYVKNKETNSLEKELKKSVLANDLQNNFYYMDASELMLNEGYVQDLNDKFKLEGHHELIGIPAIVYLKDSEVVTTLSSTESRMLRVDDFVKLLDSYEIIDNK